MLTGVRGRDSSHASMVRPSYHIRCSHQTECHSKYLWLQGSANGRWLATQCFLAASPGHLSSVLQSELHSCVFQTYIVCAGQHWFACADATSASKATRNIQDFGHRLCRKGLAVNHTGLRLASQTFKISFCTLWLHKLFALPLQETLKSVIAQYNASQLLTMREVYLAYAQQSAMHASCWPGLSQHCMWQNSSLICGLHAGC